MTGAQAHRGPDGFDDYADHRVALGHRRLSIIDVSAAGAQPMCNEDRSVWVTYNGELYNFRDLRRELVAHGHTFHSRTDTEVIVHGYEQWGAEGLLTRLHGMFAFGLYDARAGLLLARDRLGIKPLYYASAPTGALLFASEVRALVASGLVPKQSDEDSVIGFLLTGSIPFPGTIVKGVRTLEPGHYLWCRDGETVVRKYWDLTYRPSDAAADGQSVGSLLQEAVSRHLVSDVPLGIFLSGGVDSGAIVAWASRALQDGRGPGLASPLHPLKTLTVTFDEPEFDEAAAARAVSDRFQTEHHEVRVTRSDFVAELPNILAAMDQPTNDGVNTYFVARAARQLGLTVVLSGLGGDEVFWGYRHYRWLGTGARWLAACPDGARQTLSHWMGVWGRVRGQEKWMRMAFLGHDVTSRGLYLTLRGFFPPQHIMRLLGVDEREVARAIRQHFETLPQALNGETANGFNYIELKRYLHDQLLRDTDVFSMAHSIEARVPFLDDAVVEHVARIRPECKVGNGINKPVLVDAAADPLLRQAGGAPKRGFSLPMDRWMRELSGDLEDLALSATVLDRPTVRSLWQQFRAGRLHWSRAWALSVLGSSLS